MSLLAKSLAKVFGLTLKPTVITELSEATASTTSDWVISPTPLLIIFIFISSFLNLSIPFIIASKDPWTSDFKIKPNSLIFSLLLSLSCFSKLSFVSGSVCLILDLYYL